MQSRIIKYLLRTVTLPPSGLIKLLPRSPAIWVFGSWFGRRFADNSKYLYLYVRDNLADIRAIWISRSRTVVEQVRQNGGEAYSAYSLTGMLFQLRAGVTVVSVDLDDLVNPLTAGSKIVQLWHGTPLKRIGADSERFRQVGKGIKSLIYRIRNSFIASEWKRYWLMPVPSPLVQQSYETAFLKDRDRLPVLGYARNDALFQKELVGTIKSSVFDSLPDTVSNRSRIITYLPTHRDEGRTDTALFPFGDFDPATFNEFLAGNESVFLYKRHFYHLASAGDEYAQYPCLIDVSHVIEDVQQLLAITDILVTDLSSCFFDFLLLNRPVIFITNVVEEFIRSERSLYYEYSEVTPGSHVCTFNGLVKAISDYLSDPEKDSDERIQICSQFNTHRDGNSSERIARYISEQIIV